MIITFLQVLYFLGKYVYTNYNNRVKAVKYTKHEDETSKEIINNDASCSNFNKTPDEFTSNEDYQPTTGNIHFSPPAYIQRYVAVRDIISDSKYQGKIRKVKTHPSYFSNPKSPFFFTYIFQIYFLFSL